MGIREQAIIDARKITSNNVTGAGVELTFISRKIGNPTAVVIGLHTRHHYTVTSEGAETNDLNAHATISEGLLVSAGYPVRNVNNLVDIKDDVLFAFDSSGVNRKYKIAQVHPDESMGLIRCILEDCI